MAKPKDTGASSGAPVRETPVGGVLRDAAAGVPADPTCRIAIREGIERIGVEGRHYDVDEDGLADVLLRDLDTLIAHGLTR